MVQLSSLEFVVTVPSPGRAHHLPRVFFASSVSRHNLFYWFMLRYYTEHWHYTNKQSNKQNTCFAVAT